MQPIFKFPNCPNNNVLYSFSLLFLSFKIFTDLIITFNCHVSLVSFILELFPSFFVFHDISIFEESRLIFFFFGQISLIWICQDVCLIIKLRWTFFPQQYYMGDILLSESQHMISVYSIILNFLIHRCR